MDKVHRIHRIHSVPVEKTLGEIDVSEPQADQIVPPRKEEYSSMNTIIIGVYIVLLVFVFPLVLLGRLCYTVDKFNK